MAVTIFGGLISATLLDVVLTLVLFCQFERPALDRLLAERNELPAGWAAENM